MAQTGQEEVTRSHLSGEAGEAQSTSGEFGGKLDCEGKELTTTAGVHELGADTAPERKPGLQPVATLLADWTRAVELRTNTGAAGHVCQTTPTADVSRFGFSTAEQKKESELS